MPIQVIQSQRQAASTPQRNAYAPIATEINAPEQSTHGLRPIHADSTWHVLHTRPRQERLLAQTLAAAEIEHYLPLTRRVVYRGRRKTVVEEPLFTSYLFLRGPLEAAYFAVSTKRVAHLISVADQGEFHDELVQIRRSLENGAELSPCRYLKIGRRVRVTAGPFRDIEGLVEDYGRSDRLVLQIAALGRATSLEIDADLLEAVD